MHDVIEITKKLIACASVTPEDDGAQLYLSELLEGAGFACHHLPFEDVPNLFARIGTDGPHLCYAGHTDVVPPGPAEAWTSPPFEPQIRDGVLYGRGASDMKGSVAAFTAAALTYIEKYGAPKGSISMLITGDEEGPALHGTVKVLDWMVAHNHIPDVALVGEPTNPGVLGEEIKVGRRGSLSGVLCVEGKQGHVAYQHLADNPLPRLSALLNTLGHHVFDEGSVHFPPTNLEITTIDVGNPAGNVIPKSGCAEFNIRFNDLWAPETLEAHIRELLDGINPNYTLDMECGGESFLTNPEENPWPALVREVVEAETGRTPAYTTNGGTSDARFVFKHCPVVEFGPINKSIHQINEHAAVTDLEALAQIYLRLLERYFEV